MSRSAWQYSSSPSRHVSVHQLEHLWLEVHRAEHQVQPIPAQVRATAWVSMVLPHRKRLLTLVCLLGTLPKKMCYRTAQVGVPLGYGSPFRGSAAVTPQRLDRPLLKDLKGGGRAPHNGPCSAHCAHWCPNFDVL